MTDPAPRLFCFGLGYTGLRLARRLKTEGWRVAGTCQSADKANALVREGIEAFVLDHGRPLTAPTIDLAGTTHLLSTVPPDAAGDPVLDLHEGDIRAVEGLAWAGYLSTTGVYGDTEGALVDETAPTAPTSKRSVRRLEAEARWRNAGLPIHVFRLPGIYGPGSSALDKVRSGQAKRIDKPGHRFCRIHVDDIVGVLIASMRRPAPGTVYNVCDDEPASPADVTAYACKLLGVPPPPAVPFAEAEKGMSAMALSFWQDNRTVDNTKIKDGLGYALQYPTYREGLKACLEAEKET